MARGLKVSGDGSHHASVSPGRLERVEDPSGLASGEAFADVEATHLQRVNSTEE